MTRLRILLFALSTTLLQGATEWTYGSSDHFEVYTTGGAGKARDALNYFERIHAFYADVLKVDPEVKAPTRIILFSNQKEFSAYRPNEGTFAFYQPGPDRDYVVMQSLIEQAYVVVVHEYMHLVARYVTKNHLPPWLNEGWADFYSTIEPKLGKMSVGAIPQGRLYVVQGMKLMPLEKLFAVEAGSPEYTDKKLMGDFYAQSWALVHMLLASEDYYPGAPKFLMSMLGGASSAEAIKEAYDVPLAKVQKDLEAYLRVGQFKLRLYDYKPPKPRKDLEVRRATAFEAKLVTANLLAISPDGEGVARTAFAELEKEDPSNLEVQESIASFEYRRGKTESAIVHFARAAELGSTNWQMYRDYGYATLDDAKRAEVLGKAVKLNEDDLTLRLLWTRALLQSNRAAQALASLVPVTKVDRESAFSYYELLAIANSRLEKLDEAKKAASRALEYANSTQRNYVQDIMSSIAKQLEFAEEMKKYTAEQKKYEEESRKYNEEVSRPRLVRRDTVGGVPEVTDTDVKAIHEAAQVNNSEVVVDARWQQLECNGAQPIMVFGTEGGPLRLTMNSPNTILLKGADGATTNIFCGDQKNRPVRVGYTKLEDATKRTAGDVRFLELR